MRRPPQQRGDWGEGWREGGGWVGGWVGVGRGTGGPRTGVLSSSSGEGVRGGWRVGVGSYCARRRGCGLCRPCHKRGDGRICNPRVYVKHQIHRSQHGYLDAHGDGVLAAVEARAVDRRPAAAQAALETRAPAPRVPSSASAFCSHPVPETRPPSGAPLRRTSATRVRMLSATWRSRRRSGPQSARRVGTPACMSTRLSMPMRGGSACCVRASASGQEQWRIGLVASTLIAPLTRALLAPG